MKIQNVCTLDFIEKSIKVHGTKYDYSKVKINKKTDSALILCKKHGLFSQRAFSHQQGFGCPACGRENCSSKKTGKPSWRKKSPEEWLRIAKKKQPGLDFSKAVFVNLNTLIQLRCRRHDVWFEQKPFNMIYTKAIGKGLGCPQCRAEFKKRSVSITKAEYQERLNNRYEGLTVLKYSGMHDSVRVRCQKHGKFTSSNAQVLTVDGRGCPKCNPPKESWLEQRLASEFPEALRNDRSNGFELDLFWKDKKFGLEIDGVYWHSTKYKDQDYHIKKTLRAKKKGIRVLHFWDKEINEKWNLVKSMIRYKLRQVETRIGARKLDLWEFSTQEERARVKRFFEENHLQGGNVTFSVAIGLCEDKEILACGTFGRSRFDRSYEWELIRFASKTGHAVVGGMSRILSHFEKTHSPRSLVSYANLRFSTGNVYRKLGFDYVRRTSPNYWWVIRNQPLLSRYQTQKSRLPNLLGKAFDSAKSERELLTEFGGLQVYDCGNLVFEKRYV